MPQREKFEGHPDDTEPFDCFKCGRQCWIADFNDPISSNLDVVV